MDGVSGQNKVSRFKTIITTITLPAAAAAAMPTALLSSPHDMAEEEQGEEERERCKNEIILEPNDAIVLLVTLLYVHRALGIKWKKRNDDDSLSDNTSVLQTGQTWYSLSFVASSVL